MVSKKTKKRIILISSLVLLVVIMKYGVPMFLGILMQNRLNVIEAKTDKIIITSNWKKHYPTADGHNIKYRGIFPDIILKNKDIKDFFSYLQLDTPYSTGFCRCKGDLTIHFYSGNKKINSMSYHHQKYIRDEHLNVLSDIPISSESINGLKSFFIKHGAKFKE